MKPLEAVLSDLQLLAPHTTEWLAERIVGTASSITAACVDVVEAVQSAVVIDDDADEPAPPDAHDVN